MFLLVLHPIVELDQEGMGTHCPGRSRAKGVGPYLSGAANVLGLRGKVLVAGGLQGWLL